MTSSKDMQIGSRRQYDDDWLFGLEEDTLKCSSSPPPNSAADMALTVPLRTCPSPLAQIPTREPYSSEAPPKLSPVPCEKQTFITLSNHVPPPQPAPSTHQLMQSAPSTSNTQPTELNPLEYELCGTEVTMLPLQSTSPVIIAKQAIDVQMVQPSTSGLQHNGTLVQQPAGCLQAVNGQWFVQAQVQHVQTSGGTVIAVVPNFCRTQATPMAQAALATQPSQQQHVVSSVGAQMHSQTLVHTSRASGGAVPVNVVPAGAQQTHSVMQQLLSQPALARQQPSSSASSVSNVTTPAPKSKQRGTQSRANGRKKNVAQGGTLGAVLAKANKLAAASSTDASLNQILPPSQGIEMRLSVQNSEQVANLSKEISRLQNLQATYNVDHSAEIKDLENKRAQIFFEALAQQHKDKDLLSAVNVQPSVTVSAPSRQRSNYSRQQQHHAAQHQQRFVVHQQPQPSTSYEQQPAALIYETTAPTPQTQQQSASGYQPPYHLSQYSNTSQTLQRNPAYDPSLNQLQISQTAPVGQQYGYTTNDQATEAGQACSGGYIGEHARTSVGVSQSNVVLQAASPCTTTAMQPVLVSAPPEAVVPPTPLYPPPRLPTSAEIAAAVTEKRQQRTQRLNDYFENLKRSVECADTDSPFSSLSDALNRLLPFHVYHEPELNEAILDQCMFRVPFLLTMACGGVDGEYLRHVVHLTERKNRIEHRLRAILCKEAMRAVDPAEECLLLSLEGEYERRKLDEERNEAAADLEAFVSKSSICAHMNEEQFQCARREFDSKTRPEQCSPLKHHVHFEYRPFAESEVIARCTSRLPDSESELGSCSSTEEEQEQSDRDSDATKEMHSARREFDTDLSVQPLETELKPFAMESGASGVEEHLGSVEDVPPKQESLAVSNAITTREDVTLDNNKGEANNKDQWIDSSPSPELIPSALCAVAVPKTSLLQNEGSSARPETPPSPSPPHSITAHNKPSSLAWRRTSPRTSARRDSELCSPADTVSFSTKLQYSSPVRTAASRQTTSPRDRGATTMKSDPHPLAYFEGESRIMAPMRQDSRPFRKRKFPTTQSEFSDASRMPLEQGSFYPTTGIGELQQLRSRKGSGAAPSTQATQSPRQKREPPLLARKRHLRCSQMRTSPSGSGLQSPPSLTHIGMEPQRTSDLPSTASDQLMDVSSPYLSPDKAEMSVQQQLSRRKSPMPQPQLETPLSRLQNVSPELPLHITAIRDRSDDLADVVREETDSELHHTPAHRAEENVGLPSIKGEEAASVRPPIKIKIALVEGAVKKHRPDGDAKKRKEKKKDKKKKHHGEHRQAKYSVEMNGIVPSGSSEAYDGDSFGELVASTLDDPSHSRILMRISRKKNACLTSEHPQRPKSSMQHHGDGESSIEDRTPTGYTPRIPKLKIRIGRSEVGETKQSTFPERSAAADGPPDEPDQKTTSSSSSATGIPKSNIQSSFAPPIDVQFSPESEASDEEADQQLRAQTDTVLSQLSGWGACGSVPLSQQSQSRNRAEAFSRLVGSTPLVNPLLGALMNPLPSSAWLLDAANLNLNHATAQSLPWFMPSGALLQQAAAAAAATRPRNLSSKTSH
ncbi:hypothetical protein Tcan_14578 [Toxocara canis]|uniref:GLTSCR protein conserved domain-containing protein n=1 Tax=Toxocara canis TaxID=6265 RepID=A0A0B2VW62_TOXCA|nr:hypothetical protein Tcan_14578 [Toxocara canis]